jgi:uncharacterized membrane protein
VDIVLSVVIRWLHVVAAWIGSSFFIIHLDLKLRPNNTLPTWLSGISLLFCQASARGRRRPRGS